MSFARDKNMPASTGTLHVTSCVLRSRAGAELGDVLGYYSAPEFECGARGGNNLLLKRTPNSGGSLINDPMLTSHFIYFCFSREIMPERNAIGRAVCALKA